MGMFIATVLLGVSTVAWAATAYHWRRVALKAQRQAADMKAVAEATQAVVDYCMQRFVPIVAIVGHWPPNIAGPPQELRKDALAAMQGATDVGITVQAHTTVTHGPVRLH